MSDADELRALAQDFERLMDPARDDMNFIYDWKPPEWFDTGDSHMLGHIRNLLHRAAIRALPLPRSIDEAT